MKKGINHKQDRGRVVQVSLKKSIRVNSNEISDAIVEIDHINFGLNKKTGGLNEKPRTNFSVSDIEKFLMLLDGEHLMALRHKGRVSQYSIRVDCPIRGRFFGKEFMLFFDLDHDKPTEIYTITLFPRW